MISVRLRRGAGGKVRVDGTLCAAPLWVRWDGATLWLVGSGASPVGEDRIVVQVDVGPGVEVAVRSVAAAVVYAAHGAGTQLRTELHVADRARVDWRLSPTILTRRARHEATATVHASSGAEVVLDEVLVLGRAGEPGGRLRSTFDVSIDGVPTLLTSVDTSIAGWSGPAGVDGARVVASRLRVGGELASEPVADRSGRAAVLDASAGCRLALAVAADLVDARRLLDAHLPFDRFTQWKPATHGRDTPPP